MKQKIKILANTNKIFANLIYILFHIYGFIYSIVFLLMRIFPLKDKIVCCNMKGKRYGDNPMYIAEAILAATKDIDIVWLLNTIEDIEFPDGVRAVRNTFWNQIYELVTAKVWVDSNTKQYGFMKRKGQLYVQTWHGSYGLKKVYGDIPDKISKIDRDIMKYNMRKADVVVSNSRQTSEIFRRAFWYEGKIIEEGSPRNDLFFNEKLVNECKRKVNRFYSLDDRSIVLYAPTYRNNQSIEAFDIDFYRLKRSLEQRFGGNWVVLIRLHPENIKQASGFIKYDDNIINATDYNVMQELLAASQILVTDYSSCMFDFVTTGKTCFLYASDIDYYKEERDCYFALNELPFPFARTNEELAEVIENYDENKYMEELNALFNKVGLKESGHASAWIANYILGEINGTKIV